MMKIEMPRAEKTIGVIVIGHEISPNQLGDWKNELIGNAAKIF
ncbi:hypothetical protein [Acetobacterium tundrae]|nr:hypothetical protein [Acetobacterium tundrae]